MKGKKIYILLIVALIIASFGCHKRIEDEIDLAKYDRIVGPEGKQLIFFRNYGDDSDFTDTMMILDIPPGALDTTVIFNYYKFYNEVVDFEVDYEFDLYLISEFFYFLPFYNEYSNVDIDIEEGNYQFDKHLSLAFNKPVKITFFDAYWTDDYTRLFRINIPKNDEWGGGDYNIWTKFNQQGYPIGYYETDLVYLINGKWNPVDPYGGGSYSMTNWDEVNSFSYNEYRNTVTFEIMDTDGMYVLAEDN